MTQFDPGLQPERTELAWRRTALTIAVGSLVSIRLLPAVLSDARWALVGVLGTLFAAVVWGISRRRLARTTAALIHSGDRVAVGGGGLLLAVALGASALGLCALAVVVFVAQGPHALP